MRSAYLLVSHGSRDPRPQVAMERLAWLLQGSRGEKRAEGTEGVKGAEGQRGRGAEGEKILRTAHHYQVPITNYRLPTTNNQLPITNYQLPITDYRLPLIGTACLELSQKPLHQQIAEFSDRAISCGYRQVQIVPLFLLPGVHVMEDIPAEVELARQALKEKIRLELRPHLGSHPGLVRLLKQQLEQTTQTILLAHGSRRKGSEQPVEAIAQQIGAVTAYWSVAPSLEARVRELAIAGRQRIAILPYFLFAGGITDAIAEVVGQLQQQFPAIEFCLMQPIGATQELADLIWDAIET